MGALRTSMATTGYRDIAEFQRAELMVAPALQTEGKQLQREQQVGMGSSGRAAVLPEPGHPELDPQPLPDETPVGA
jgi:IMP dehydrogenase